MTKLTNNNNNNKQLRTVNNRSQCH